MRFEGIDDHFVVKVLYKQLSLGRVSESHAICMMTHEFQCTNKQQQTYVFSSLYRSPIIKMFISKRFANFYADYIWRNTSCTNEL